MFPGLANKFGLDQTKLVGDHHEMLRIEDTINKLLNELDDAIVQDKLDALMSNVQAFTDCLINHLREEESLVIVRVGDSNCYWFANTEVCDSLWLQPMLLKMKSFHDL